MRRVVWDPANQRDTKASISGSVSPQPILSILSATGALFAFAGACQQGVSETQAKGGRNWRTKWSGRSRRDCQYRGLVPAQATRNGGVRRSWSALLSCSRSFVAQPRYVCQRANRHRHRQHARSRVLVVWSWCGIASQGAPILAWSAGLAGTTPQRLLGDCYICQPWLFLVGNGYILTLPNCQRSPQKLA